MAIAERHLEAVFGKDLVDHHTYALVGDGCLMEGISQGGPDSRRAPQAQQADRSFDDNGVSIDGPVSLADATDQPSRFAASGWAG